MLLEEIFCYWKNNTVLKTAKLLLIVSLLLSSSSPSAHGSVNLGNDLSKQ